MKFVVTGGAGFIGSHIAKSLINEGHTVTIIDNLNTGKIENLKEILNQVDFVKGDIRDIELLKNKLKDVDGVFHEAALASVQESFSKIKEYGEGAALQILVRHLHKHLVARRAIFEANLEILVWADSEERARKILGVKPEKNGTFDFIHRIFENRKRIEVGFKELKEIFIN